MCISSFYNGSLKRHLATAHISLQIPSYIFSPEQFIHPLLLQLPDQTQAHRGQRVKKFANAKNDCRRLVQKPLADIVLTACRGSQGLTFGLSLCLLCQNIADAAWPQLPRRAACYDSWWPFACFLIDSVSTQPAVLLPNRLTKCGAFKWSHLSKTRTSEPSARLTQSFINNIVCRANILYYVGKSCHSFWNSLEIADTLQLNSDHESFNLQGPLRCRPADICFSVEQLCKSICGQNSRKLSFACLLVASS